MNRYFLAISSLTASQTRWSEIDPWTKTTGSPEPSSRYCMRTPLTSVSLANGADVALHGITRLSSKEARADKRTMASSQFCWLLSPAVRLDSFSSGVRNRQPESGLYYDAVASAERGRPWRTPH